MDQFSDEEIDVILAGLDQHRINLLPLTSMGSPLVSESVLSYAVQQEAMYISSPYNRFYDEKTRRSVERLSQKKEGK